LRLVRARVLIVSRCRCIKSAFSPGVPAEGNFEFLKDCLEPSLFLDAALYRQSSFATPRLPSAPTRQTPPRLCHSRTGNNPCYDDTGLPQRCVPDFINAAFNLQVEVTNTCGVDGPTSFCVQSGHSGIRKVCDICDNRVPVSVFFSPFVFEEIVLAQSLHRYFSSS
uniref:Laminin N-terminal domain-containing protein n=1 Tax=Parascaris equorum TaxID=6256 RepID=A0A914RI63_PAREQ